MSPMDPCLHARARKQGPSFILISDRYHTPRDDATTLHSVYTRHIRAHIISTLIATRLYVEEQRHACHLYH
jgi:hypothetical protein